MAFQPVNEGRRHSMAPSPRLCGQPSHNATDVPETIAEGCRPKSLIWKGLPSCDGMGAAGRRDSQAVACPGRQTAESA